MINSCGCGAWNSTTVPLRHGWARLGPRIVHECVGLPCSHSCYDRASGCDLAHRPLADYLSVSFSFNLPTPPLQRLPNSRHKGAQDSHKNVPETACGRNSCQKAAPFCPELLYEVDVVWYPPEGASNRPYAHDERESHPSTATN